MYKQTSKALNEIQEVLNNMQTDETLNNLDIAEYKEAVSCVFDYILNRICLCDGHINKQYRIGNIN